MSIYNRGVNTHDEGKRNVDNSDGAKLQLKADEKEARHWLQTRCEMRSDWIREDLCSLVMIVALVGS